MAIDPDDTGVLEEDTARRLIITRAALNLTQEEFAEPAGISQPRYNPYEQGRDRAITLDAALKLCEHHLLTLDWIYRGDPSGLPYRLTTEIMRIRREQKKPNPT